MIELPAVREQGDVAVETALAQRRSVREYASRPLTLAEVSQLLWAAQGVTNRRGDRTAPSAGALFPLEVYLAAGSVDSLATGSYLYRPRDHAVVMRDDVDRRAALAAASCRQTWLAGAPVLLVIAAVTQRTRREYGQWAERYVAMEVGHAAQNVHLQAVALGLGTVVVGAIDEERVRTILDLPPQEEPLAIMPVGGLRSP